MIGWFRWSWQWLDVLIQMIVAMIKRWLFQFNRRLQADPNLPHMAKLANDLILWLRRWWCFNIPYVSKNLKRETAIMAKLNHPIFVSVQEVVSVGSFYCLVLDFFPWWRRRDWEREESFELLEEISRWFFNYDHHFFDGDGNDQISMKMIVRTKKAFDLNYVQKRKSNVCSGGRLCSSILDSCPIFEASLLLSLISAGPGYHDYERMVNDDECAVCVFVCMRVCFCLFSLKTLVSHWGNVNFHMSQDRSCIVVWGISKGQILFRKALRKSGRSPVDLSGFLMAFLLIWRKRKKRGCWYSAI